MPSAHPTPTAQPGELLDDPAELTVEALARACRMDTDWVIARLQEGLLQAGAMPAPNPASWRLSGATVVRARRLAQLEVTFDADPHLAALTADLIEEVVFLRRCLRHAEESRGSPP